MDLLSKSMFTARIRLMSALAVATAMEPALVERTAKRIVPITRTGELVQKYRRKYSPHQGRQECARRFRQIENCTLTSSNGLVTIAHAGPGAYAVFQVDSHGRSVFGKFDPLKF